jgi:hypothetical protein
MMQMLPVKHRHIDTDWTTLYNLQQPNNNNIHKQRNAQFAWSLVML